ncbi:hypothetical protein TNCV_4472511 [Trichonephila clavipes]|uniref:Uncharacterized protein n=1 Tax=Trichonephila clavipes TaxID=2585209 RepID=A0A8X6SHG1_TRICX|nr:hypothetical protein TNCV_4472511 [Trichonephila clavipes]
MWCTPNLFHEIFDHPQGVLPLNWDETELNCSVTCMVLKATANERRHLALCHEEFREPWSGLFLSENVTEVTSNKDKLSQKLAHELEELKQKLRATEEDLKRTRSDAEKYHKTLCNLKEGLQSSLFLTDSALQKSRSSRSRSSPFNKESDSCTSNDNNTHQTKQSKDSATETNGVSDCTDVSFVDQNSAPVESEPMEGE